MKSKCRSRTTKSRKKRSRTRRKKSPKKVNNLKRNKNNSNRYLRRLPSKRDHKKLKPSTWRSWLISTVAPPSLLSPLNRNTKSLSRTKAAISRSKSRQGRHLRLPRTRLRTVNEISSCWRASAQIQTTKSGRWRNCCFKPSSGSRRSFSRAQSR